MSKAEKYSKERKYTEKDVFSFFNKLNINYESTCSKIKFTDVCSIEGLKNNSITWVKEINDGVYNKINGYNNLLVISDIKFYNEKYENIIFIPDLKNNFFELIKYCFSHNDPDIKKAKIEDSSVILSNNFGDNLYVGHHSFIDENVMIGNNVTIMNNVVIQGKVEIGDNTFIESGAVIGAVGFGYYKDSNNHPQKVPHLGKVIIGNYVTIGAGSCISRGSLNDTIIKDYVKIDNLCHIAHSVHLDEDVMVAACAEISGSVHIGENTWIAPGVTVINGTKIGKDVFTGIGTNIVKNVPDNVLIYGNPGKIKE